MARMSFLWLRRPAFPVSKLVSIALALTAASLQELSQPPVDDRIWAANGTPLLFIEVKWYTVFKGLECLCVFMRHE